MSGSYWFLKIAFRAEKLASSFRETRFKVLWHQAVSLLIEKHDVSYAQNEMWKEMGSEKIARSFNAQKKLSQGVKPLAVKRFPPGVTP